MWEDIARKKRTQTFFFLRIFSHLVLLIFLIFLIFIFGNFLREKFFCILYFIRVFTHRNNALEVHDI